jgi:hypothetical protein
MIVPAIGIVAYVFIFILCRLEPIAGSAGHMMC